MIIGTTAVSCQIVGSCCKIRKAKISVRSGSILAWLSAFVTLIRCMPSIHKIFESPSKKIPLIRRSGNALLIAGSDIGVCIANAIRKRISVLTVVRTNIIVSLVTCFRALCEKKLPNGAIAFARRMRRSPI